MYEDNLRDSCGIKNQKDRIYGRTLKSFRDWSLMIRLAL